MRVRRVPHLSPNNQWVIYRAFVNEDGETGEAGDDLLGNGEKLYIISD